MSKEIKKQIKQQILDVDLDFMSALGRIKLTREDWIELTNYWYYLKEIAEELNNKNN